MANPKRWQLQKETALPIVQKVLQRVHEIKLNGESEFSYEPPPNGLQGGIYDAFRSLLDDEGVSCEIVTICIRSRSLACDAECGPGCAGMKRLKVWWY